MDFIDQYGTDEWKQRRSEIIEIDNGRCRRCQKRKDLQVHHIHYVNGRKIWEYSDQELVTLCQECHLEIHHYKNELNECLFSLMNSWCVHENTIVSDYYDALQILRYLSMLGGKDSKLYANICASAGMSFLTGGCYERMD